MNIRLWTKEIGELGNSVTPSFLDFYKKIINYMFYFINKIYSINYQ